MEENKKVGAQELGQRLVGLHVYQNINSLVEDLTTMVAGNTWKQVRDLNFDADDLEALRSSGPDYEEAATQEGWRKLEDHEHYQLWEHAFVQDKDNARSYDYEEALILRGWERGENEGKDAVFTLLNHGPETYKQGEIEAAAGETVEIRLTLTQKTLEEDDLLWQELALQLGVAGTQATLETDEDEPWQVLCTYANIDTDDYRREPYEFWIVSDWLARHLERRGEIVVELYRGMYVWGRCTTGQAILLDGVIRDIALETWPDEFDGSEY